MMLPSTLTKTTQHNHQPARATARALYCLEYATMKIMIAFYVASLAYVGYEAYRMVSPLLAQ